MWKIVLAAVCFLVACGFISFGILNWTPDRDVRTCAMIFVGLIYGLAGFIALGVFK